MEGTTCVVACACGRSFVVRLPGTLRRVREETDREVIWVTYVNERFHHVCGVGEAPHVE